MNPRFQLSVFALSMAALAWPAQAASESPRPNIIFILTDDLGYGDVGVFFQDARKAANDRSQPWHLTPRLDAMAEDGVQLRDHYCPAPVCAPSRASLLLGVTQGHANVRDNQFDKALEPNHTLATVLKQAGYATACIGKWGLQGMKLPDAPNGWPAHPMNRGFDEYFGYISHNAGHWHYPKEDKQMLLEGSTDVVGAYDGCYTTDLFTARAKKWIGERTASHPGQPFFLYLAYDTPHAKQQYPPSPFPAGGGKTGGIQWEGKPGHMINTADGNPDSYCYPEYANATWDDDHNPATPEKPWPDVYKRYASSIHRIDDCVGDLIQYLKDLHIDDNTLVVFASDNGPSIESYLPEPLSPVFFHSFGPFDGIKRDCWEAGIRVGSIARWPGHIPAHRVAQEPSAFWDWMPTFAEVAGLQAPARSDGVSLVPTLTGQGKQEPSEIYFEYFEGGKTPSFNAFVPAHRGRVRRQMQAIRIGDYIGVRYNVLSHSDPFEIYNIVKDPQEVTDLGGKPDFATLQQRMKDTVLQERRPNPTAKRPYDAEFVPAANPGKTAEGVEWKMWKGAFPWVPRIAGRAPDAHGVVSEPSLSQVHAEGDAAFLFSGYIDVPTDGAYEFHLTADSGALLRIHDATVIDADAGYHGGTELSGTAQLHAGRHPFRLYVKHAAAASPVLSLKWSGPNLPEAEIDAKAFSYDAASAQ